MDDTHGSLLHRLHRYASPKSLQVDQSDEEQRQIHEHAASDNEENPRCRHRLLFLYQLDILFWKFVFEIREIIC